MPRSRVACTAFDELNVELLAPVVVHACSGAPADRASGGGGFGEESEPVLTRKRRFEDENGRKQRRLADPKPTDPERTRAETPRRLCSAGGINATQHPGIETSGPMRSTSQHCWVVAIGGTK